MKRSLSLIAVALLAAACSTQNDSSVKGEPGSPLFERPLRLSCVEKQTMVDAPGYEHDLSIRRALQTASTQRRSVSMEGYGEWEVGELPYDVEETTTEDGALRLSLKEAVNTDIDWAKQGSCYKLVPQQSYRLERGSDGQWKGTAELIGHILINPAVSCDFPHVARPPQYELACSEI